MQRRAYLTLASLTGMDLPALGISTADLDSPLPFVLTTKPEDAAVPKVDSSGPAAIDEAGLVKSALERRPETRTAELARELAEHSIELSQGGPPAHGRPHRRTHRRRLRTSATNTTTRANGFVTTNGSIGLQVNYDIGGIPAAQDDIKAQTLAASKAKSDEASASAGHSRWTSRLCILNLERAERDLASTAVHGGPGRGEPAGHAGQGRRGQRQEPRPQLLAVRPPADQLRRDEQADRPPRRPGRPRPRDGVAKT